MSPSFEEEKPSQIPRRNAGFYGEAEDQELPAVGSSPPWHQRDSQELNPSPVTSNNLGNSSTESTGTDPARTRTMAPWEGQSSKGLWMTSQPQSKALSELWVSASPLCFQALFLELPAPAPRPAPLCSADLCCRCLHKSQKPPWELTPPSRAHFS